VIVSSQLTIGRFRDQTDKTYVLIIVTDIREQKRVEAQLRESNALLEGRQNEIEADLAIAQRVQQSLAWKNLSFEAIGGTLGVILPKI
jgi:hypothetical protein